MTCCSITVPARLCLEDKVAALTPEQVSAAFRRHVDAAALIFVKAGDFKKAGVLQ